MSMPVGRWKACWQFEKSATESGMDLIVEILTRRGYAEKFSPGAAWYRSCFPPQWRTRRSRKPGQSAAAGSEDRKDATATRLRYVWFGAKSCSAPMVVERRRALDMPLSPAGEGAWAPGFSGTVSLRSPSNGHYSACLLCKFRQLRNDARSRCAVAAARTERARDCVRKLAQPIIPLIMCGGAGTRLWPA